MAFARPFDRIYYDHRLIHTHGEEPLIKPLGVTPMPSSGKDSDPTYIFLVSLLNEWPTLWHHDPLRRVVVRPENIFPSSRLYIIAIAPAKQIQGQALKPLCDCSCSPPARSHISPTISKRLPRTLPATSPLSRPKPSGHSR